MKLRQMLFLHFNYSGEYCLVLYNSFLTRSVTRRVQDVQNTRASTYQRAPAIEKKRNQNIDFSKIPMIEPIQKLRRNYVSSN